MTVRDRFESMLVGNGMFESQAKEVMDIAIPQLNESVEYYQITFNRPQEEYQCGIYGVIFDIIKPIALKWIEDNAPNAWFKPMFM